MDVFAALKDSAEWVGLAAIMLLMTLCIAAIFGGNLYRHNWLQFAGIWMIVFADAMRLSWLYERWLRSGDLSMSWAMIALHIGLLMYAIGTACKVVIHHRQRSVPA